MTQANVSRLERDRISPSLNTLNRLLEAMGETLTIGSMPLSSRPPGGANPSIRDLRRTFDESTHGERIERAAALSKTATALKVSGEKA